MANLQGVTILQPLARRLLSNFPLSHGARWPLRTQAQLYSSLGHSWFASDVWLEVASTQANPSDQELCRGYALLCAITCDDYVRVKRLLPSKSSASPVCSLLRELAEIQLAGAPDRMEQFIFEWSFTRRDLLLDTAESREGEQKCRDEILAVLEERFRLGSIRRQ